MRQKFLVLLKKYSVLVLAGLGVIVFLGITLVSILSRGGGVGEDTDSGFVSTATMEVTETETVDDEARAYYDYVWYEDDYVKFEYPKGWEVEWSTLGGFDSFSRLNVSDGHSSLTLDKWCGHFGLDRWFLYDQEESKKFYILPSMEETNLYKEPFISKLNFKNDIFLFVFGYKSFEDSRFEDIHSSTNVYLAHQMDDGTYEIWEPYLNLDIFNCEADPYSSEIALKYGKGNHGVRVEMDCAVGNENDANQCAEFINRFFESVGSKGNSFQKDVVSESTKKQSSDISTVGHYYSYVWYEDDHIKFLHPKDWQVDVKSGKAHNFANGLENEKALLAYDFEGVYELSMNDFVNSLLFRNTIGGMGEDLGYCFDPKVDGQLIYRGSGLEPRVIKMKKNPIVKEINSEESLVFTLPDSSIDSSLNSVVGFASRIGDEFCFSNNGASLTNTHIVSGQIKQDGVSHNTDSAWRQIGCEVQTEEDIDKCFEYVKKFFDSVERKK
jgi:hypothetical protein